MNLKEALLTQAPSLALQRAAADEIARLTKALEDKQAKAKLVLLTDEEINLAAHNLDPGDWNSWHYRDCWHSGFSEGAKAAVQDFCAKNGIKAEGN